MNKIKSLLNELKALAVSIAPEKIKVMTADQLADGHAVCAIPSVSLTHD